MEPRNWRHKFSGAKHAQHLKGFLVRSASSELLEGLNFSTPPLIDVSGVLHFGQAESSQSVIGQVSADDFSYKDAAFTKLRADFAWDGTRSMLRNIRLQQNLGALSADLYSAPNDFRLNIESSINPGALRSLVPTGFSAVSR